MERTLQDRLKEWGDEVAARHIDPDTDPLEELAGYGGPDAETAIEAIEWSNTVDREVLLFTLALCVSEVVRRYGVEATQITLSGLLQQPSIRDLGEIVHAGHVIETGGIPERFAVEDFETTLREKLEGAGDEEGVIVINMDTGEIV